MQSITLNFLFISGKLKYSMIYNKNKYLQGYYYNHYFVIISK